MDYTQKVDIILELGYYNYYWHLRKNKAYLKGEIYLLNKYWYCNTNFRYRDGARNNGTAHFMQIPRLILKFPYDSGSYEVMLNDFLKNMFLLLQSDEYRITRPNVLN